jgi:hypothetical protein
LNEGEIMKGCNHIKQIIDEADKPEQLPFEVSQHLAGCSDCERFAGERTALRRLMSSADRVSPPMNFDAVLTARLAEVKAHPSFEWFGAPGYLRLASAAAGLIVMIFAAQYAGLFVSYRTPPDEKRAEVVTPQTIMPPVVPQLRTPEASLSSSRAFTVQRVSKYRENSVAIRNRDARSALVAEDDGGVVFVRGQKGANYVQMPTVSVGAQPLLYVSAGQRTVRSVGASF